MSETMYKQLEYMTEPELRKPCPECHGDDCMGEPPLSGHER